MLRKGVGLIFFVMVYSLLILLSQGNLVAGFSPSEINRIADSYIQQGRYQDAVVLLELYMRYYPQTESTEQVMLRIGYCWYLMDERGKSIHAWKRFITQYPESEYIPVVIKLYKNMNKHNNDFSLET